MRSRASTGAASGPRCSSGLRERLTTLTLRLSKGATNLGQLKMLDAESGRERIGHSIPIGACGLPNDPGRWPGRSVGEARHAGSVGDEALPEHAIREA
jgi:hypothetical protein